MVPPEISTDHVDDPSWDDKIKDTAVKYDRFISDQHTETSASEITPFEIKMRKGLKVLIGLMTYLLLTATLVLNKLSILAMLTLTKYETSSNESLKILSQTNSSRIENLTDSKVERGPQLIKHCLSVIDDPDDISCLQPNEVASLGRLHFFLILLIPAVLNGLANVLRVTFGKRSRPKLDVLLFTALMEICHTFGSCLLVYYVLPKLSLVHAIFALCGTCIFLPSIIKVFVGTSKKERGSLIHPLLTFLGLLICIAACTVLLFLFVRDNVFVYFLVSIILCSFGYWESFAAAGDSGDRTDIVFKIFEFFYYYAKGTITENTRHYNLLFTSIIKTIVLVCFFSINESFEYDENLTNQDFYFKTSQIRFVTYDNNTKEILLSSNAVFTWWIALLSAIFSTLVASSTVQMSLYISFSGSLLLTTPLTVLILYLLTHVKESFGELGFYFNEIKFDTDIYLYSFASFWILQIWLAYDSIHLKFFRYSELERIFVFPKLSLYAETVEQFLLMTKRRDVKFYDNAVGQDKRRGSFVMTRVETWNKQRKKRAESKSVPIIYCCGTMWHESIDEMKSLLLSLLRLDDEKKKETKEKEKKDEKMKYEVECHIFFDDAFKVETKNGREVVVPNSYVQKLISVVDHIRKWNHKQMRSATKLITPYGGKIVWVMPNGTELHVHLKDKELIRHKKRWSQIMYLQYLLTYRIRKRIDNLKNLDRLSEQAAFEKALKDVYILALDGDVDFQPEAVWHLFSTMMMNPKTAAVCGEIKPLGNGMIYWYQRFEYAVGHWLQKSAEHSLGSVLCSPGCFSLFRASALADKNVAETYSKLPEKPEHYIQYDQGEDRWLCTLLIQKGYAVAYNSNSISYTNAPEDFHEFYNQRRRWGPSTLANVIDLLSSASKTVQANDNISWLYMIYQMFLTIISLIGPATILLVLAQNLTFVINKTSQAESNADVSAPSTDFCQKDASNIETTEIIVLTVVISVTAIYVILCKFLPSNIQINIAYIFTIISSLMMLVVFLGMIITIKEKVFSSLQTYMILLIAFVLTVSGILHFALVDLLCGFIYVLLIPSMYLFLTIFGFSNLNNVSWGTREAPKPTNNNEKEPKTFKAAMERELKGTLTGIQKIILSFCTTCFPCMFTESKIVFEIDNLKTQLAKQQREIKRITTTQPTVIQNPEDEIPVNDRTEAEFRPESAASSPDIEREDRGDWADRSWLNDKDIFDETDDEGTRVAIATLQEEEIWFFLWLISAKLYPLEESPEDIEEKKRRLAELRDKVCFAVYLLNGLWMLTLVVIQASGVAKWCFAFREDASVFKGGFEIDFLNLIMMILFGSLALIQFFSMCHIRWLGLKELVYATELLTTEDVQRDDRRNWDSLDSRLSAA